MQVTKNASLLYSSPLVPRERFTVAPFRGFISEFDITFELFTLLPGLAMAEVLAGYIRVRVQAQDKPKNRRALSRPGAAGERYCVACFLRSNIGSRYWPV